MMEKEELIFDKLNKIISNDETEIPMPEKIRKIIDQAKKNLAERSENVSNISDFLNEEDTIPLAKCALDGTEEKEKDDDPLKDLIDDDE